MPNVHELTSVYLIDTTLIYTKLSLMLVQPSIERPWSSAHFLLYILILIFVPRTPICFVGVGIWT